MAEEFLYHHGIPGQKWGVRRFQNEDGSLTASGKIRYAINGPADKAKRYAYDKNSIKTVKTSAKSNKTASSSKMDHSTGYDKNDADWKVADNDKNPDSHRVGDTDFFIYTRSDGSRFMVEEDMKWEVPSGITSEEAARIGQEQIDQDLFNRTGKTREEINNEIYDKMADDVILGKYGNGADRVKALGAAYDEVQKRVNKKLRHSDSHEYELYHHGIKGQKWGVRRFQNPDGSYTEEGKRRRNSSNTVRFGNKEIKKSTLKKVAVGAVAIGTVAAAAVYVKKHPEAIARVILRASNIPIQRVNKSSVDKGKSIVKEALKVGVAQAVRGAKEGLKEAPMKVAKATVEGAAIIASNKLVEKIIGKEKNADYIQAYNAYNKKNKIGRMPSSEKDSGNDEEDE